MNVSDFVYAVHMMEYMSQLMKVPAIICCSAHTQNYSQRRIGAFYRVATLYMECNQKFRQKIISH